MGITKQNNRWLLLTALVAVLAPLFLFVAGICTCHNQADSVCHTPGLCSSCMPELDPRHKSIPCLVCSTDVVVSVLPEKAVLAETVRILTDSEECSDCLSLQSTPADSVIPAGGLFEFGVDRSGWAEHSTSTILRI